MYLLQQSHDFVEHVSKAALLGGAQQPSLLKQKGQRAALTAGRDKSKAAEKSRNLCNQKNI